jgi:hypothetical protein
MKVDCLIKNPAVEKHYREETDEQKLDRLKRELESLDKIRTNIVDEIIDIRNKKQ